MKLLLQIDDQDPQEFVFKKTNVNIGKSNKNDIVLDDASINDIHIMFKRADKGILLEDNHSTHGTFVNGTQIKRHHLMKEGDVITLGKCQFVFYNTLDDHKENLKDEATVMISDDFQKELQKELSKNNTLLGSDSPKKVIKQNISILEKVKRILGLSLFSG